MLYHPSALRETQFEGAEDIVKWSSSLAGNEDDAAIDEDETGDPILKLDPSGLERRLSNEEHLWREWLPKFQASATSLATLREGRRVPSARTRLARPFRRAWWRTVSA
jgi:hypothetical protein